MIVTVVPVSNKAKNRFHNVMNHCGECLVEQETPTQFFLASSNRKYFFWMNKVNDSNWSIQ